MSKTDKLRALISLLDDSDTQTAIPAMAELLRFGAELEPFMSELQESSNPLLRRRVHQMQSIIKARDKRRALAERLRAEGADLRRGLNELHLQWYDSDSDVGLDRQWVELVDSARSFRPRTTRRLMDFMAESGFIASGRGEVEADYYCVGSVIDERVGADFVLCAVALVVGKHFGWGGGVVRAEGGFALLDGNGQAVFPSDWRSETLRGGRHECWNPGMLLRHAAYQLLLCAVSVESVRYVYTLGSCLAQMLGDKDVFSLLPSPYNGKTVH